MNREMKEIGKLADNELEERNRQWFVSEFKTDFVCVYVFRGDLTFDQHGRGVVMPGDLTVIEVYNRADSSVWFTVDETELSSFLAALRAVNTRLSGSSRTTTGGSLVTA